MTAYRGKYADELIANAAYIATPGKGILAADESTGTIGKRFAGINVENVESNRKALRELLFTTPGAFQYLSGVILFEETLPENCCWQTIRRGNEGRSTPRHQSRQGCRRTCRNKRRDHHSRPRRPRQVMCPILLRRGPFRQVARRPQNRPNRAIPLINQGKRQRPSSLRNHLPRKRARPNRRARDPSRRAPRHRHMRRNLRTCPRHFLQSP